MFLKPRHKGYRFDQLVGTYEFLSNRRIMFLYGAILNDPMKLYQFSSNTIADSLFAFDLDNSERPVYLIIDSPGGSVSDGMNLYDAIKAVKCPVYTIGRNAYSLAAVLLAAGEKGKRYVFQHSRTMLHLPSGQFEGDAVDVEIQSKEMHRIKNLVASLLVENGVKRTHREILKDIDREKWFEAQEAIEYGLADKIIEKGFFNNTLLGGLDGSENRSR